MRSRCGRTFAALSLAAWLASSALGQLLWLHVEVDHADSHHHEPHDSGLLLHHADPEDGHEHPLWTSDGLPASSGSRLLSPPALAVLPVSWAFSAVLENHGPDPEHRPRGRPFAAQRHAILLI